MTTDLSYYSLLNHFKIFSFHQTTANAEQQRKRQRKRKLERKKAIIRKLTEGKNQDGRNKIQDGHHKIQDGHHKKRKGKNLKHRMLSDEANNG